MEKQESPVNISQEAEEIDDQTEKEKNSDNFKPLDEKQIEEPNKNSDFILNDKVETQEEEKLNEQKERLFEAQKILKQVEAESQILANRIALLKQEELKTLKKINETKKKTQEIVMMKKKHVQYLKDKEKMNNHQLAEVNTLTFQNHKQKQTLAKSLASLKTKTQKRQQLKYAKIKSETIENEKKIKEFQQNQYQEKAIMAQLVKEYKSDCNKKAQKLSQINEETKNKKKLIEINKIKALAKYKQEEAVQMEQLELELISKLQSTQQIQKQAFQQLEDALNLPFEEFDKKFGEKQDQQQQQETEKSQKKTSQQGSEENELIKDSESIKEKRKSLQDKKIILPKIKQYRSTGYSNAIFRKKRKSKTKLRQLEQNFNLDTRIEKPSKNLKRVFKITENKCPKLKI